MLRNLTVCHVFVMCLSCVCVCHVFVMCLSCLSSDYHVFHVFIMCRQVHAGYSLFEWNKVCQRDRDMAGTKGRLLKITSDELAKHSSQSDLWTSVRGELQSGCVLIRGFFINSV